MAKKRKIPKRTPEEIARSDAIWRKLQERFAYHEAKLAEERALRATESPTGGRLLGHAVSSAALAASGSVFSTTV